VDLRLTGETKTMERYVRSARRTEKEKREQRAEGWLGKFVLFTNAKNATEIDPGCEFH
jgi:hypothetical protein